MAAIIQVISCPPHIKLIGMILSATASVLADQQSSSPQPGLFDRTHTIMNTGNSQENEGINCRPIENRSNPNAISSARNDDHLGMDRRTHLIVTKSSLSEIICAVL